MNTGKTIETERLLLIPGSNARDIMGTEANC